MSAPTSAHLELRASWAAQLKTIGDELSRGFFHRKIYTEFRDALVRVNPQADATFLNVFSQTYAHSQSMLVRRLCDRSDDRPTSLWWLIEHIRRNPKAILRDAFLEAYRQSPGDGAEAWEVELAERRGAAEWVAEFGDMDHVDPEVLRSRQDELTRKASRITAFATRRVAHLDRRTDLVPTELTFNDIHVAIDELAAEVNRYNLLLHQSTTAYDLLAVPMAWWTTFDKPLFARPEARGSG